MLRRTLGLRPMGPIVPRAQNFVSALFSTEAVAAPAAAAATEAAAAPAKVGPAVIRNAKFNGTRVKGDSYYHKGPKNLLLSPPKPHLIPRHDFIVSKIVRRRVINNKIEVPMLPFRISRTASKDLPVYSDVKNQGRTRLTVVRRVSGDAWALKTELHRLLGNSTRIDMHTGRISIAGDHTATVRRWLISLGL